MLRSNYGFKYYTTLHLTQYSLFKLLGYTYLKPFIAQIGDLYPKTEKDFKI